MYNTTTNHLVRLMSDRLLNNLRSSVFPFSKSESFGFFIKSKPQDKTNTRQIQDDDGYEDKYWIYVSAQDKYKTNTG